MRVQIAGGAAAAVAQQAAIEDAGLRRNCVLNQFTYPVGRQLTGTCAAPQAAGMSLAPALRKSASWLLDAILPPRCLKCGEIVADSGALCGALLAGAASSSAPPCCACCGLPFEFEMGEGSLCGACTADRPLYDRARAALTYDDASRDLILRFKHADRIDGAATFAGWMARAGAELVAGADIIAPVPLHRWRLVRRRYNQAAILANAIGASARKTRRPGPAGAAPARLHPRAISAAASATATSPAPSPSIPAGSKWPRGRGFCWSMTF